MGRVGFLLSVPDIYDPFIPPLRLFPFVSSPSLVEMSLSGIIPINSGPLVIRTYNDISDKNTYLLGQYDYPISSNYILTTSNNGQLVPTSNPTVSSLTVGSLFRCNQSFFSTLETSTFTTGTFATASLACGPITCSSITANGTAQFRGLITNITEGSVITLNSEYWSKYVFVRSNEHVQLTLIGAQDGSFMSIRNIAQNSTTTVVNVFGGTRTVSFGTTLTVMYNSTFSQWYSMSNN